MSYLLFAVFFSAIGVALVLWWNRRTVSMESGMKEFAQGLRALAPDSRDSRELHDREEYGDDASAPFGAGRDDKRERGTG